MFDKYKLQYEMRSRHISSSELCDAIGISKSAFSRKMNGKTEFTIREVQAIVDVLHLASPIGIFFADKVS